MHVVIWTAVVALSVLTAGCPRRLDVECIEDSNCDLGYGGVCLVNTLTDHQWCAYPDPGCPSGYRYSDLDVGDGVSGVCVPEGEDPPSGPLVTIGQPADLVLGQELFTTAEHNHLGISASSLWYASGVSVNDAGSLLVFDTLNARVLQWRPAPLTSFAAASIVIGEPDFTTQGTSSCLGVPTAIGEGAAQISANAGRLLIPMKDCNRVLIWNPAPTTSGAPAQIVLGQSSFAGYMPGNGAGDLNQPSGVWTDGTRVAVADTGNSRVLIWRSFPTTNKQPADLVLGQQGFGTSGFPTTPTAATMRAPRTVYSDGTRLYVGDTQNSRVLVWRSFPTTNGQPADFAIGQPALTTDGFGISASQLSGPYGIVSVGDSLFIVDSYNHRVLEFSPIPSSSGAAASSVLGQQDFTSATYGTTQTKLNTPAQLAVDGTKLYVSDDSNSRVLRFSLRR